MARSPLATWQDRPWVLVSSSPTRLSVLREQGIEPSVAHPTGDETMQMCRGIEASLIDIALGKLGSVATTPDQIGLACDTLVLCDDTVLGKPLDESHARQMLELQLKLGHQDILTGVALRTGGRELTGLARARVELREGARDGLEQHLSSGAWAGIAGGYDYQPNDTRYALVEGTLEDVWGMPVVLIAELLSSLV